MRDDRRQPRQLQFVEGVVHGRRNGEIRELHQEVILLIERETKRVEPNLLEIFEAEMEIAPSSEGEPPFKAGLNFVPAHFHQLGDELMVRAGVWRSNYVGNAVGN